MSSGSSVAVSSEESVSVTNLEHHSNIELEKEEQDFSKVSTNDQVSLIHFTYSLINENPQEFLGSDPEEKLEGWKRYVGIMLAFGSTLMFSFHQIMAKGLLDKIKPLNLGTHLLGMCFLLNIPVLLFRVLYNKTSILDVFRPFNEHKWLLFLSVIRGICSGGSYILLYYGLKAMDVGDAVVILSSGPVFVYILGWVFLKEKIGIVIIFTAILAIGGVMVIMKPPFITGEKHTQESTQLVLGSLLVVAATLAVSIGIVALRTLKHVHHALLNFIMYVLGAIICVIPGLAVNHLIFINDKKELLLLFGTGCMLVLGQIFLVVALEYERAGVVALIRTLGVVLAFLWQYVFPPHKPPDPLSILGTAMILTGVIITIVQKWLMSLPEEHRYRRRFRFLLK